MNHLPFTFYPLFSMLYFEEYFYLDSKRLGATAEALTMLVFRGGCVRERLERAIAAAMRRAWLLTVILQENNDGTLRWVPNAAFSSLVQPPLKPDVFRYFAKERTEQNGPWEAIDLTRSPGVRFWVYDPPETDCVEVVLQFHHAVTDALGSFLFLEEILRHYAEGNLPERPVPTEAEIWRSQKMPSTWRFGLRAAGHAAGLLWCSLNPFGKRPAELHGTPEVAEKKIPFVGKTFSSEETQRFLSAAKSWNVTFNDLLTAVVFQSLPRVFGRKNPLYRMAVPVSIRTDAEKNITLANLVSIVFLEKTGKQCDRSLEPLLAEVSCQMRNVKRRGHAQRMLKELQWLHDWQFSRKNRLGGMRWFVNRKTPMETLIVSNLGVLFGNCPLPRTDEGFLRVGEMVLEDIQLYSPRTTGVSVTLPVGTYAGRLRMYVCYDPDRLSNADAEPLLEMVVENLRRFLKTISMVEKEGSSGECLPEERFF